MSLAALSPQACLVGAASAQGSPPSRSIERLERSWQRLDAELRALDQLLPGEPELPVGEALDTPGLPAILIRANQAAAGAIQAPQSVPAPPLALPTAQQLQAGSVAGLSLEQALAIAFANSASLQAQRELVASALASLQAAMGSYWPTISAFASGGYDRTRTTQISLSPNDNLGFGPQFAPNGLLSATGQPTAGAYYVPDGGSVKLNTGISSFEGGLQLNYALLDFARTPNVRTARANLEQQRNTSWCASMTPMCVATW